MNIFLNGFWGGFYDYTNAVNVKFFLKLMEEVYNTHMYVTFNIDEAEILIENTQISETLRNYKNWKHTYLFSGESYIRADKSEYSCVLFGNRNHNNIINVPLYIPYIISSFNEDLIKNNIQLNIKTVPENEVLVLISNPAGSIRNSFIQELEKHFRVTYAGNYKNNIGKSLKYYYNTPEFRDYVGKFKFVLSMENSEEDTYITEKITHGLLSGSIPIYWGSKRVTDYFNSERFLEIKMESDFPRIIETMKNMTNDEWLRRVNLPAFTEFGKHYTIKQISKNIKNLLFKKPFPRLTSLYMICNKEYEPVRYDKLLKMCNNLELNEYNYNFICPTFKHTITDEIMTTYVKTNRIFRLRNIPIRKSEISLYLNFKAVFEHIEKNYLDGIFLVLEADAFVLPDIKYFNNCLSKLENKDWSGINISSGGNYILDFNPKESYVESLGFRDNLSNEHKLMLEMDSIEDISNKNDTDVRFMRRFHTRCTDSQIWSYKGACQMLDILNNDSNYDIPLDYYFTNIFETNLNVKYYWSDQTYFDQNSNLGLDVSSIQNDIN